MGKLSRQQLLAGGVLAGLSALSAWAGYYVIFQRFDEDEGYVMITLKYFMRGFPLYDNVYTQYGPAFYLLRAIFYPFIDGSHDRGRIFSLVIWVLIALLVAYYTYRVTHSVLLAAVAQVVTFRLLTVITEEPGHPQELCGLILALALVLSLNAEAWPLLGILAGILLLIKINIGGLFLISIGMLLANRWRYVSMLVAVLLPVTLMRHRLVPGHEIQYAVVATVSILAVCLTMLRRNDLQLVSLRDAYIGLRALVTTAIAICGVTLLLGTSLKGLIYGVLVQHITFGDRFDFPLTFRVGVIPSALLAFVLAIVSPRSPKLIAVLKLGFFAAFTFIALKGRGLSLFGWGRGDLELLFTAPYLWLGMTSGQFPRTFACSVASLQILQAFPIPGSQAAFGTFFLVPISVCALPEAFKELLPNEALAWPKFRGALLWALIAFFSIGWGIFSKGIYESYAPVDFPGTKRIRMKPDLAAKYTLLVQRLTTSCDAFITWPGDNSLYFWTEQEPPTHSNATQWSLMLTEEQQREVVRKLAGFSRPCAVVQEDEKFRSDDRFPLVTYISTSFHEVEHIGDFRLMKRN